MIKLTESTHYEIYGEYELVILKIKDSKREVMIGDFYGDVEKVIISSNEQYCIMAGCGIIVYSLKEPFERYEYEKNTTQWKEWCRDGDVWIEDIILEGNILTIHIEADEIEKIGLDELFKGICTGRECQNFCVNFFYEIP